MGTTGKQQQELALQLCGSASFLSAGNSRRSFPSMDMVRKPIEQRSGKTFGAEYLGPFVEGKIAGGQRGAPLVTLPVAEGVPAPFSI